MNVISSYYATPTSSPVLLHNILENSTTYYPSPTSTTDSTKRKVLENAAPYCVSRTVPVQRLATKYNDSDLTAANVNTNYSCNSLNGYITVPIGDLTYMTATSINGYDVSCAYTSYTGNQDDFSVPVFVDTTNVASATLLYNAPPTNRIKILGHLVIPIYNLGLETAHYYSVDNSGNLILPTAGVPYDLQNQVVFVPQGTTYTIYD